MRLTTLRVINNFGLDFKQFIAKEEVLKKIVAIIKSDASSLVEQRDAMMTLKSLSYEVSDTQQADLDKIVTIQFLIDVLRTKPALRDQVLIMIKQQFSKHVSEQSSSQRGSCLIDWSEKFAFLDTPEKAGDFFELLTLVFNESISPNATEEFN